MASLNFRAINKGAGGRRRLSVWHYISWTEYLHSQLSSSSSAAAAEFPARVLQQTVSHHLRCLCKPPPKLRNTVYDRALPASIIYLLSLPPLLVFVFLLRWEKVKHHYTKYTGNIVCDSISRWYLIRLCHDMLVIWDVYWIYTRGNVNLAGTFRSYVWLLLYCKIHTNGAPFSPEHTRVHKHWLCRISHIHSQASGGATVYKQRRGSCGLLVLFSACCEAIGTL